MPRHKLRCTTRFHHLKGIPPEYQGVLFAEHLRYTGHALARYASRLEPLIGGASRPEVIDPRTMRLLASDVVDDKVVMQVWRLPLEGLEQDMVLAVSDEGRVATVWVVEREDVDGIWRPKAMRGGALSSGSMASPARRGGAFSWHSDFARRGCLGDASQVDVAGFATADGQRSVAVARRRAKSVSAGDGQGVNLDEVSLKPMPCLCEKPLEEAQPEISG